MCLDAAAFKQGRSLFLFTCVTFWAIRVAIAILYFVTYQPDHLFRLFQQIKQFPAESKETTVQFLETVPRGGRTKKLTIWPFHRFLGPSAGAS